MATLPLFTGDGIINMDSEETGSPGWNPFFFMQTTEDTAKAVAAVSATGTGASSPRPPVVFSLKDDSGGQLQKLQRQVSRVLKGLSNPPVEKGRTYNPEVLTIQKRQWASSQLQSLDHRVWKEPSRIFESMVVVGLHPNCDIQALEKRYHARNSEGSGRLRSALVGQHQLHVEPNMEPQVLFVYPPEKQLPLKYKDLLSFCFPGGLELHAVEKAPSMSKLNEILLGQEHLKQSEMSFIFRLQVANNSTLYGCCVLVDEIVQKPSGLVSLIQDGKDFSSGLSRHVLVTRRCYCILSRVPFFQLHFSVLNSIFMEERLERLTQTIIHLDLESSSERHSKEENLEEKSDRLAREHGAGDGTLATSQSSTSDSIPSKATEDKSYLEDQALAADFYCSKKGTIDNEVPIDTETEKLPAKKEPVVAQISEACDTIVDDTVTNKQQAPRPLPNVVLPFLRYRREDRNLRSDVHELEIEEASFSGQEDSSEHDDILEWAKANNHGTLQIICKYYQLRCPEKGSTIKFSPLEHLHPLEYHRSDETVLHVSGSTIDLKLCSTSLEFAEAHNALAVEEEATALSVWTIACMCGSLQLEHVLILFAGALLEKQIVVICSNLGILSAVVLSIIPLIRPYQWQSLLMPVLPEDMLDFLDAPVPYVVGVKNKTSEVESKLTNVILVDANKNQVRSHSIPLIPQHKELISSLRPHHEKLVGESYLGRKRPIYECTDVQVEAAKSFLAVLRTYLDSLCTNLRSHTITNVQSNDDKVSLLLKESFIESFPSRDQPFMKLFVDTQLFSVHTDLVLSFIEKE
ncbi:hypothetical protein LguiA_008447 [Lonicera macranthoides]